MSLKAVHDALCVICNETIKAGEITRPLKTKLIQNDTKELSLSQIQKHNDLISWSHLSCVQADDERVPICKHWSRRGFCMFQTTCLFRHPISNNATQTLNGINDKTNANDAADVENEDIQRNRRGNRCRRRVCNDGRAGALRRWIIDIFGIDYLKSGSGILDVAGGKGELAFELVNLNDIPTCVIDPRKLELNRYCRKLEFGYYHRNDYLKSYNSTPQPSERNQIQIPTQLRCYFEMTPDRIFCQYIEANKHSNSRSSQRKKLTSFYDNIEDDNTEEDELVLEYIGNRGELVLEDSENSNSDSINNSIVRASTQETTTTRTASSSLLASFQYPKVLLNTEVFTSGRETAQITAWTNKGLSTADDDSNSHTIAEGDKLTESSTISYDTNRSISTYTISPHPSDTTAVTSGITTTTTTSTTATNESAFPVGVEISDLETARQVVRDCSLIVGMHPDQAAEHILDFAIRNNKPCAFIPCCVYSSQFPRRKKIDGTPVRKYGDLIEYLISKLKFCVNCSIQPKKQQPLSNGSSNNYNTSTNSSDTASVDTTTSATPITSTSSSPIFPTVNNNSIPNFGIIEMDFEGKNLLIYYLGDYLPLKDPYCFISPHIARGLAQSQHWWKLTDGYKEEEGEGGGRDKMRKNKNKHNGGNKVRNSNNSDDNADSTLLFNT